MQLMMARASDQIIKDFSDWFTLRQKQIQKQKESNPVEKICIQPTNVTFTNNGSSSHAQYSSKSTQSADSTGLIKSTGNADIDSELAKLYSAKNIFKNKQ